MRWLRWKGIEASSGLRRNLDVLEKSIGYRFRQPALAVQALKHRSYLDISGEERTSSNERLEFLGDAVLSLVVSEYFYQTRKAEDEGIMTGAKSTIVSGTVLAEQARRIGLGDFILLSENEAKSGGRDRDSILEDAFEALIGAIYLDGGIKPVRTFVRTFLLADIEEILAEKSFQNYKSALQEYAQGKGGPPPVYRIRDESGPDHDKTYVIEVLLDGKVIGSGSGRSKKEAEQNAAAEGLKSLPDFETDLKED